MSCGLLLPSDTHCTDFFIALTADELRRMESGGLGSSSRSPSIGEAGDVVSGAESVDTAATAAASGDDPVVAGELDCELGGGSGACSDCREWWPWRRLRRR